MMVDAPADRKRVRTRFAALGGMLLLIRRNVFATERSQNHREAIGKHAQVMGLR